MESSRLLNFPALVTWGNLTFVPLPEWEMLRILIPPFQLVKLTSNINNIKEIYSNDDLNCFLNNISAQKNLYTTHSGPSQAWIEHAYPLQQVTILLQGTRHSEREDIISQLKIILSRLKNGENTGFEHDDDFGYSFQYDAAAVGKSSFFDEAAGRK